MPGRSSVDQLRLAECAVNMSKTKCLCFASGERLGAIHRQRVQPALERRHVIGLIATCPQLLWEHTGNAAPLVVRVDASAGEQRSCSRCFCLWT